MPVPALTIARGFATTHWTVVHAAAQRDAAAHAACEQLCLDYWYPIYAYLCRLGHGQDAGDLTQDFLTDILRHKWLSRADESRGKFRSFLLTSLHNFLHDKKDRQRALKRCGTYLHIPLDALGAESRYARSKAAISVAPADFFEVEWATEIVTVSLRRLEEEYAQADKAAQYKILKSYLGGDDGDQYQRSAQALGMTEATVRVYVHRLRQRYSVVLREEVARTVSAENEIDGEMRHLRAVFANLA